MRAPHKSITVSEEVFERLDKIREKRRKELKLPDLSWNAFFSQKAEELEAAEKPRK